MVLTGKHTTSDGAQIAYELHGEDLVGKPGMTPMVLIMGLSGVMPMWHPFAPALGATRPTLIFDHRGIGLSTIPEDYDIFDLTYDVMVDDALSLIGSFGWDAKTGIHILGYSMGGHILMHLLTREDGKPDAAQGSIRIKDVTIKKAILAATMTRMPRGADFDAGEIQAIMNRVEDKKERDQAVTEYMIDMQYYPEWIKASSSNKKIRDDRIDLSLRVKPSQMTTMAQMQAIGSIDVRPVLSRIPSSVPVLVLHGRKDRMVAFAETEHTTKGIAHADTLFLDKVAHFWYDMNGGPDFWVQKIGQWLDQSQSHRARL
ncbi:hypothetical protein CF319_g2490 [Tilletia indica]|uniref:AB hydrolase-1 domain-containing protein n=1 Tax=Tilletia indica TaxID=43049 RepID=A0A177TY07_9BASI|nr:hypothetical protein CF327_g5507 [Tilletia walkeri]KAE8224645.1 hypothetical protein CF319_g2490 [Tilletia indica]KAE8254334.1 hypothetical protein A4X13_0g3451 [Tilletia indica]